MSEQPEWYVALCRLVYVNEPHGLRRYTLTPAEAWAARPTSPAQVTDEARDALIALGWTAPEGER